MVKFIETFYSIKIYFFRLCTQSSKKDKKIPLNPKKASYSYKKQYLSVKFSVTLMKLKKEQQKIRLQNIAK